MKIWIKGQRVKVKLVGADGNAFAILGRVRRALRDADYSVNQLDAFTAEATTGDYNNLLAVVQRWVDVV